MATRITSKAPTRIDLAGGTIDIWPLYLFLDRATTINLGIDLFAEAELVETRAKDPARATVRLRSEDQNVGLSFPWQDLSNLSTPPQLELHAKLLRHFALFRKPTSDLSLSTRARSPAGAGLGGSSTLSIAVVGALASWAQGKAIEPEQEGEKWIDLVRDVETTVIQVPAGMQDYYGAMYGGLQSLQWSAGRNRREWLPDDLLPELESRLLLFYSGQSRNSGINNWALFKGFIDRSEEVKSRFTAINAASRKLEEALLAKNWSEASRAIAQEWSSRKMLAQGISTPEIDRAFASTPGSGKICGAGGGGCFFVFLADPSQRPAAEKSVLEAGGPGIRPLPFRAARRGLEVRVTTQA